MELPANRDVHNYPGGLPYKTDGDARPLALGCKLQILVSLKVFGMESHYIYICPIQVSLSTVHKEIQKRCPDSDKTEISLRDLFKLEPHPYWSPLVV